MRTLGVGLPFTKYDTRNVVPSRMSAFIRLSPWMYTNGRSISKIHINVSGFLLLQF